MGVPPEPNGIRIHLLGGFLVWVGPNAIEDTAWRLNKSKAIVKLLALAPGHSLARDQILDALWPRLSADDAVNNFHQTLHAARRTFSKAWPSAGKEAFLSLRGQVLTVRSPGSLSVDVEEFARAAAAAQASRDMLHYEQAIGLYSGDLLPEDRYEDWTTGYRDTLARSYLGLLLGLANLHEDGGRFADAINALNQALEHEPADEDVHVRLMRVYALAGQQRQARRQYQDLQDILRRELDATPQPSTAQLLDDILAARFPGPDTDRGRRAASRPVPRARPARERSKPPGNLPIPLTSFIGRERELAELKDLLAGERLLTLTGPAGSGKTRLALELAARAQDSFPDGTWWVDLQGLGDPTLVSFEVASRMGVREQPGRPIEARLVDRLGGHQALLVLDNCEHLTAGCAAIAERLLRQCQRLNIVVTSRERLGVTGEMRWLVPPMAVPPRGGDLAAREIMRFESVQFFVNRSGYVRPGFTVNESSAQTIAQICQVLDGLPLLIELAAARTHLLSLEVIRDRLADRLSTLALPGAVESRYRTISEAIGWSYRLLSEEERLLFNRLGVFAGPFTLEAAHAICGDCDLSERTLDHLSSVVDKSMLSIEESSDGVLRYRLLHVMCQYALERLNESGEVGQIQRRCYEWYLDLAERAAPELNGRNQRFWFRRLEDEHANFRGVLAWCQSQEGGAEPLARLASALYRFWYIHGHNREGRTWTEAALANGGQLPASLRARAHAVVGAIAKVQADFGASRAHREEALKIFRATGDRRGEGGMLRSLGWLAQDLGEYAKARALHQESLSILREEGDKVDVAFTLHALGWMAQDQGDYVAARAMHDESLAIFREAGDMLAVAISLRPLGRIAQDQGDCDTARSLHQQSLEIFRELGGQGGIAISLYSLGRVAYQKGDFEQAAALFHESLAIFNKLGNRWGVGRCLHGLGEVARLNSEPAAARSLLQESLACFRDLSFKEGIGLTLAALGGVAVQEGDRHQARELYVEALRLLGELGFKVRIAECMEGLAGVAASEGDPARAARLLGAAAALRERLGTPIPPCARPEVDHRVASVKARLGPQRYAAEWEEGRRGRV